MRAIKQKDNEMTAIKPIDRKYLKPFRKFGDEIVTAEVFDHPNAIGGGILVITDCLGERYYEDKALCGFDNCLAVALRYK